MEGTNWLAALLAVMVAILTTGFLSVAKKRLEIRDLWRPLWRPSFGGESQCNFVPLLKG